MGFSIRSISICGKIDGIRILTLCFRSMATAVPAYPNLPMELRNVHR